MNSIYHALGQVNLFSGLSSQQQQELAGSLSPPRAYAKGELIVSSATTGNRSLGILLKGQVKICRPGRDGPGPVINRLKAGGMFGAAGLFGGGEPFPTDIIAAQDSLVLFLSEEDMLNCMQRHFQVAENYIRFLSGRIRFLNRRIAGYTGGQAEDRLLLYLQQNCREDGLVTVRSMAELAQLLDMGRTSLYRSLDKLEQMGTIRRQGKHIYYIKESKESEYEEG